MNPTRLLPNTSSWVNFSLFTSKHAKWQFMHPLLYLPLLYSAPWGVATPRETDILHQRQYPLAIIISERENGSLTYARHVRNLQAPFVDASPIRMVFPLRMQPPHFHRCQSSCAWLLETFCTKTQGALNTAITRDSSVIWKEGVCALVLVQLCVRWNDMMQTKRWGQHYLEDVFAFLYRW